MTLNFWFSCLYLVSAGMVGMCHLNWFYVVQGIKREAMCMLGFNN